MTTEQRRVLLVAYQFPPVGGAGVQRVAKFTKYLPRHHWDVSVLTVSNPSVPVADPSLAAEIPAETLFCRAPSWEPGYGWKKSLNAAAAPTSRWARAKGQVRQALKKLATVALQPDPQILWVPQAIRYGLKLLKEVPHQAIMVSGPPFSAFLVGAELSRRSSLPLVLDYHDEWSISNRYWENKSSDGLSRRIQTWMQQRVLRQASLVLATTRRSVASLQDEVARCGRAIPVRCLYNGFDAEDLPAIAEDAGAAGMSSSNVPADSTRRDSSMFRLAHIGTLWNLTTARPLIEAIERLAVDRADLAARLELEIVGRCTPEEETLLQRIERLPCRLLRRDYVDHPLAVEAMGQADQLCLLLADVPGAERVVPAKVFEYLATGRELLAIAPPGEVTELLRGQAGVAQFAPHDVAGIAAHLVRRLEAATPGQLFPRELARFERQHQASELADLLDQLVPRPSPRESVRPRTESGRSPAGRLTTADICSEAAC